MRSRREWWIALSVLAIGLGTGALLWVARRAEAPKLPEVGLIRESLGQFPKQPGSQHVAIAFPVDLNDDGETEAVAVFERLSSRRGEPSVWSDLKGRFEALPAPVFPPPRRDFFLPQPVSELTAPVGQAPLLRELLGWDATKQQVVRLRFHRGRMAAEPASDLKLEQFPYLRWLDRDEDGQLETVLVEYPPRRLAFHLVEGARWDALPDAPPNPDRAVDALHHSVTMKRTLPDGRVQTSTPGEFFYQYPRPTVLLPDGDGDGKPEQLDVVKRVVRFSRGGATPFPRPFKAGEQIRIAELDGVAPREILYASRADDPAKFGFQLWVYRLQGDKLQLVAVHKLLERHYLALAVKDLDGDGRDEIIGNEAAPPNKTRWVVWQFENGGVKEQAAEHPIDLDRLDDAQWLHTGRNTISGQATHELSERALRLNPLASSEQGYASTFELMGRSTITFATVLVGLPEGEHRANPKHWKTLAVDGRVLWHGDYDGDGVEEYAITNFTSGGVIAQFREGKWRLTPLQHTAPLVAAFPAQRKGTPQLILVYRDGKVEAIRIQR